MTAHKSLSLSGPHFPPLQDEEVGPSDLEGEILCVFEWLKHDATVGSLLSKENVWKTLPWPHGFYRTVGSAVDSALRETLGKALR